MTDNTPDTSPVNSDAQKQLTTEQKIDVIYDYVKTPEYSPPFWGLVLLVVIVISFVLLRNKRKELADGFLFLFKALGLKSFENADEYKKDRWHHYVWLTCWLLTATCMSFVFFQFGLIPNPEGFAFSKTELLFAVALIFTIVGAFWSVFSRIESEKAFKQSEKTYNALGSTFDFSSFFDKEKLPKVYESIGEENSEVSLYVGFPIVGLPYEQRAKLKTQPEDLFGKLVMQILSTQWRYNHNLFVNWTINIGVFSRDVSLEILENIPDIDDNRKQKLKDELIEFYNDGVEYFKNERESNGDYVGVRFIELERKEKFRFVTIKKANSDEKRRAFVWVVNFINGGVGTFDSMVFQTEENKFLDILENIFHLSKKQNGELDKVHQGDGNFHPPQSEDTKVSTSKNDNENTDDPAKEQGAVNASSQTTEQDCYVPPPEFVKNRNGKSNRTRKSASKKQLLRKPPGSDGNKHPGGKSND